MSVLIYSSTSATGRLVIAMNMTVFLNVRDTHNETISLKLRIINAIPLLTILLAAIVLNPNTSSAQGASTAELRNTDGSGLRAKLKHEPNNTGAAPAEVGNNPASCTLDCSSPFASSLGIVDNAKGFSNCQSNCIHSEYSFLNLASGEVSIHKSAPDNASLHYIGLIYQCVEYARRWWMKNLRITFGDIDSAYEIIYLTQGKNIDTNDQFELARSVNGTAKRPPKRGDLLVYYADKDRINWQYGHVEVDLHKGTVSVAEQNYNNLPWSKPQAYSRQLPLYEIGGRYQILDVNIAANKRSTQRKSKGGEIAGWIYPSVSK